MKKTTTHWRLIAALILVAATSSATELDTAKIDELTGLKGQMNKEEGVYKVTFPRDEVKVTVAGWEMPPLWASAPGLRS